jgi:transposase-like protein
MLWQAHLSEAERRCPRLPESRHLPLRSLRVGASYERLESAVGTKRTKPVAARMSASDPTQTSSTCACFEPASGGLQILKPKTNMRRHIAPEDKAQLVLLFIRSKQSAAALCRKNRISESNYYRLRKIFVLAGTEALRRSPKRAGRTPMRRRTKYEDRASVDAEKMRLLQSLEAGRSRLVRHTNKGLGPSMSD